MLTKRIWYRILGIAIVIVNGITIGLIFKYLRSYSSIDIDNARAAYQQSDIVGTEKYLTDAVNRRRWLGKQDLTLASRCSDLAVISIMLGKYQQADELFTEALEIHEKALGKNDPLLAVSLNNIGLSRKAQGKLTEAREFYHRAISIAQRNGTDKNLQAAVFLNNLAVLEKTSGDFSQAESHFQQSRFIDQRLAEHELAGDVNNLGALYLAEGKYGEAEISLLQALELSKKTRITPNLFTGAINANLALCYALQSKPLKAEPLFQQALATDERLLGGNAHIVAKDLINLASLYYLMGQYSKTLKPSERAQELLSGIHPDNPEFVRIQINIASILFGQGKFAEAEQLLNNALNFAEHKDAADSLPLLDILNALSTIYIAEGKYSEAELTCRRSLDIGEKLLGKSHPLLATPLVNLAAVSLHLRQTEQAEKRYLEVMAMKDSSAAWKESANVAIAENNLASLYASNGDNKKALSLLFSALMLDNKIFGPSHPRVAIDLSNIGHLYLIKGEAKEADSYLRQALKIKKSSLGMDHFSYAITQLNLSASLIDQNRYIAAEPYCKRAIETFTKLCGPESPYTAAAMETHATLLWQTERGDQAAKLEDLLAKIRKQ